MDKNFYIGLDIGTDSVGWAVTDEEYNLIKARGQDLWGSYLFEEAQPAENRRLFRTARRRLAREHQRILLLQNLFAEEIEKTDETFFLRMNNSALYREDKPSQIQTVNVLFNDVDYKDKDYFAEFPTVYHLRSALLRGQITDVRKLYLGIHHIIKHRGHFLFEEQTFNVGDEDTIKLQFSKINQFLEERDCSTLETTNLTQVLRELCNKKDGKQKRWKTIGEILQIGKDKQLIAIVKSMTGCTVNLKDLYCLEEDFDDIKSFSFDKAGFDETDFPKIEDAVGSEEAELVNYLKSIYDWSVLCEIMKDKQYLSDAKVEVYEKHKSDLRRLKDYIQSHCPEKYAKTFRHDDKIKNYAAYIGMDKQKGYAKCSKEDFYAFLKKEIQIADENILQEMENGEFLPKQVSNENGVIPYQVHLSELEEILKKAEKQFPFLNEVTEGTSVSQKICLLMTYRVPYYVGPLNTQSQFAWAVRKEGQERTKVTPWNFDSVIDKDASENAFIRRMTNKCTYLKGEDVLPASSFLYSEFAFLNELNNLTVNGVKNAQAREIVYAYAKEHKKVTLKKVMSLLVKNGLVEAGAKAEEVLGGTDGDFKMSLTPWCDFKFLGERVETHREMCEEIILWITLLSDKNRLERRIKAKYGDILTDEEIKRLKGLNYAKWGRLSEKFLNGITSAQCADENGELMTIIQAMRTTGENLMQILADKYGFQNSIAEFNAERDVNAKVTYKTVEDLYCSPAVKRSIWRSIDLVREICKICKGEPKKVFVETVRQKNDDARKGKRTVSRKQQLIDLYKNIKEESRDWVKELENTPDLKFNSDKLVLYYRQMGRSMYSNKPIRLEDVFNQNICDIDHIFPQSKIKDDSLGNRVLVYKTENTAKGDAYPISADVRAKMYPFWAELKEKGLISEKKWSRLTRTQPLTQDELTDFINRQLVETAQSTKAVIEVLKEMLPDSEIVYAKADNANDFKSENKLVKVRELNDLHHAKDAYINIVVGNVYNTKFNHNAAVYFKKNNLSNYNIKYLYSKDIPGAWKVADKQKILDTIRKNTCKVVRMTERGKGALFNATIKTKGANDKLIPLKTHGAISDTSKYGGYDSTTTAYFMLVRSEGKKGKVQLSLEAYPLMEEVRTHGAIDAKLQFCCERLQLKNPEILIEEIKLHTLFKIDGSYAYLNGRTGVQVLWCNANELFLEEESAAYLKKITNYMRAKKKLNNADLRVNDDITAEENLKLYDVLLEKLAMPMYSGLSIVGQIPFLKEKRFAFEQLSLEEQCKILMEILKLMQCNSAPSDFKLLGGVANAGKILTAKAIQDKDIKMILQSPTGFYRKVIDINRLK